MSPFYIWFFGTLLVFLCMMVLVIEYTKKYAHMLNHYRTIHPMEKSWIFVPALIYIAIYAAVLITGLADEMLAPATALIVVLMMVFALLKAFLDVHHIKSHHDK